MQMFYKIIFYHQSKVYEIYANHVSESDIFGFIEVEDLIFRELSALVLDTSEERLRAEFSGVKRTFIPSSAILRIDQVEKSGVPKIRSTKSKDNNISLFPGGTRSIDFLKEDTDKDK